LVARDLYEQCVHEDSQFAPAWAQLGRIHRLVGVYLDVEHGEAHMRKAEQAFARALELNPRLSLAHNFYAYLEVDLGRAKAAMVRLLECAKEQSADPDIYAGLVHACRYCGLLEASIAAHEKARRLDPNIRTSVCHAYWFVGDLDNALATDTGETPFMKLLVSIRQGQIEQVIAELKRIGANSTTHYDRGWALLVAALEKNRAVFDAGFEAEAADLRDPEAMYYWSLLSAYVGDTDRTLEMLRRAVDRGWSCYQALASEPWLDVVRSDSRFTHILRDAEAKHREAAAAFVSADGNRLLGIKAVS
jgi:tetratricopeptide (TPR) repeat protein